MTRLLPARPVAATVPAVAAITGGMAIAALALALRLTNLGRVAPDPFYDAAVRSMGTSWHDFLFGALEPGGSVAIDKPAVALWPQVVSTQLLGFNTTALLLPVALAGAASVGLLYVLARSLWGSAAGLASAAALAVLPVAVLTSRSDTMDALATALTLLAALALVRAREGRWLVAAAGAALGLAFNVKLFQALVPVPALAVLYFAASPLPRGERLSRLALGGSVALAVGLSWLAVVSTAPGREQPFAFGSGNGSALSATFGYNGLDRLRGSTRTVRHSAAALAARPDPPGPARLVGTGGDLGGLLGTELVPALILGGVATGAAAAAAARRRRAGRRLPSGDVEAAAGGRGASGAASLPAGDVEAAARGRGASRAAVARARLARAGALGTAAWLLTGLALFSFVPGLQIRYLDTLAPAVALTLGGGVSALARWARLPGWVTAVAVAALLFTPAAHALKVVHDATSDSGHLGELSPQRVTRLSRFLAARTAGQRYEVASATATKATPVIARDGRPVLMLSTLAGRPLVPLRRFIADVRNGEVSYVLMAGRCGPRSALRPGGCGLAARWAMVHGRNVSRAASVSLYEVASHHPLSRRRYPRKG